MDQRRFSNNGEWGDVVEWNAGDDGDFGYEIGAAEEEVKRWFGIIVAGECVGFSGTREKFLFSDFNYIPATRNPGPRRRRSSTIALNGSKD